MAKKFSASDMLNRSQVRQPRLEAEQVTSKPVDTSPGVAVDESISKGVNASTGLQVDQVTGAPVARYQKTAVFFAPHQKSWLRQVSRDLPEGLSASDLVRLAVERLLADVDEGLELQPALIAQARAEAERYAGRRNSGVNQLVSN